MSFRIDFRGLHFIALLTYTDESWKLFTTKKKKVLHNEI